MAHILHKTMNQKQLVILFFKHPLKKNFITESIIYTRRETVTGKLSCGKGGQKIYSWHIQKFIYWHIQVVWGVAKKRSNSEKLKIVH